MTVLTTSTTIVADDQRIEVQRVDSGEGEPRFALVISDDYDYADKTEIELNADEMTKLGEAFSTLARVGVVRPSD